MVCLFFLKSRNQPLQWLIKTTNLKTLPKKFLIIYQSSLFFLVKRKKKSTFMGCLFFFKSRFIFNQDVKSECKHNSLKNP